MNTPTILSEQEIRDALGRSGIAYSNGFFDVLLAAARCTEFALLAKLAQGVELEVDGYCVLTPNGSKLVSPDEAKGSASAYPFVTLSTAQAAVAAERVKVESLQRDCAEAYQVIGAGMLGTPASYTQEDVERALDNLAAAANGQPREHEDLLPWPKEKKE